MRPGLLTVQAAGSSKWFQVNYIQQAFGIGLGYLPWGVTQTLTCKVQHCFDDFSEDNSSFVSITRVGAVATITYLGIPHRASVGDSIYVWGSNNSNFDGARDAATIVDEFSLTVAVANSGATASPAAQTKAKTIHVFDHATMTGMTTRTDGNYFHNVMAIRLNCTSYTAGNGDLWILTGAGN